MSSPEASKICEHMNKDHRVSLFDYVCYFTGTPLSINNPSETVELIDVTLEKFTLLYAKDGSSHSIDVKFKPTLKFFGEARARFIDLAFRAADHVHHSPYQITQFVPYNSSKAKWASRVWLLTVIGSTGILAKGFTGFSTPYLKKAFKYLLLTLPPMFIIHLTEYYFIVRNLLKYHRVPAPVQRLYFWITLLCGFPAWVPLKARAKELAERRSAYEERLAKD